MVGFVTNSSEASSLEDHAVTCFYGKQNKENSYEKQVAATPDLAQKESTEETIHIQNGPDDLAIHFAQTSSSQGDRTKKPNLFNEHVATEQTDVYIDWINQNNLGWEANPCML